MLNEFKKTTVYKTILKTLCPHSWQSVFVASLPQFPFTFLGQSVLWQSESDLVAAISFQVFGPVGIVGSLHLWRRFRNFLSRMKRWASYMRISLLGIKLQIYFDILLI